MSIARRRISFGPGLLVTAAFIGPGTVITASQAGAKFGFALGWAIVFAVIATIVLQEMAARLGVVSGRGLGEALRDSFPHRTARVVVAILVVSAIGFGNAAFEMGNITGAAAGLSALTGFSQGAWALAVGGIAIVVLAGGGYRSIERVLIPMVLAMSAVFFVTACIARPDVASIFDGLLRPSLPSGSWLPVIALIGTTVVPYNLFLHARAASEKWSGNEQTAESLKKARVDTVLSVVLGGGITLSILVAAATAFPRGTDITSSAAMAHQLEPLLGKSSRVFFSIGLFAAGLTSAVTAPLAAAYATAGILGWGRDVRAWRFRATWLIIVLAGTILSMQGYKPVHAIMFAQAANGVLLPIVAVFLLVVMNRTAVMRKYVNGICGNVLGAAVVAIILALVFTKLIQSFR